MSESPFQRRGPRRIGGDAGSSGGARKSGASKSGTVPFRRRRGRPSRRREGGDGDGGNGEEGKGRRDLGPLLIGAVIVIAAVLMVVLFVQPIALLDRGDSEPVAVALAGDSAIPTIGITAQLRDRLPTLPDTLRSVSPIYDLEAPALVEGPYVFTLRLNGPTQDQRNLGAYTYIDGGWERLSPALLTDDGVGARVELASAPSNLAILRRLQFRDTVTGTLPAGSELDAEAVNTLTIINPFGFVPAEDGSLLGRVEPMPPDVTQPIYPVVRADQTLTDTINTVIASEQLRRQHISNILLMVQSGRRDGVDIDYLFISPALRAAFTAFITELADQLHRDGRGISIHVPLPRIDASGFNEGAYDLALLGAAVDLIKLRPPQDQSIFRDTLVAALPGVLNRVSGDKVLLTLSPFSVATSRTTTQRLTQREALGIASLLSIREPGPVIAGQRVTLVGDSIFQDGGASGLFWDRLANMVAFSFTDSNGDQVTIWIENRFSIAFKLNLIAEFKLGGLALEDVSADPGQADLWPVINDFLESGSAPLMRPNPERLIPIWEAEVGELTGSGGAGWVVWTTPGTTGMYEVRLIASDGDVRVGRAIAVTVER